MVNRFKISVRTREHRDSRDLSTFIANEVNLFRIERFKTVDGSVT